MDTPTILGTIGLAIIIIAWIVQLINTLGKSITLSLFFVWLHLIGVLSIVISSIGFKSIAIIVLTIILAILAIITIIVYPKKKLETKEEK